MDGSHDKCHQCEDDDIDFSRTKPVYDGNGDIIGIVCQPCRLRNVEYARRCQLTMCSAIFDGVKQHSFRTLPAKFYDMPEGDLKRSIIVQFGINKDTKACCNMCYLRLSKAVSKAASYQKQFELPREAPENVSLFTKTGTVKSVESSSYTGPQFRRKEGHIPFWLQRGAQKEEKNPTANVINPFRASQCNDSNIQAAKSPSIGSNVLSVPAPCTENVESVNLNEGEAEGRYNTRFKAWRRPARSISSDNDSPKALSSDFTPTTTASDKVLLTPNKLDTSDGYLASLSDSKPLTMKLKRITPTKSQSECEEEFNGGSDLEIEIKNDEDSEISPSKKRMRRSAEDELTSDFVACIGCNKVCSTREAKAMYDFKKGFIGRLCSDCRIKKREVNKQCYIRGCTTEMKNVSLRIFPPVYYSIRGKLST